MKNKLFSVLLALAAGGCASPSSGPSGRGEDASPADSGGDDSNDGADGAPTDTGDNNTDCQELPQELEGRWCTPNGSCATLPDALPGVGPVAPSEDCWATSSPRPFEGVEVPTSGVFVSDERAEATLADGRLMIFIRED